MRLFKWLAMLVLVLLALVGALVVAGGLLVAYGLRDLARFEDPVPERAVLTLDLADGVVETTAGNPFVFAGLDIAIVFSVLGAIVGEFVGAQSGLGNLILQFNFSLDIAGVFAVLILLSVMGVALHLVMQAIQKRVIFWAEPDQVIGA